MLKATFAKILCKPTTKPPIISAWRISSIMMAAQIPESTDLPPIFINRRLSWNIAKSLFDEFQFLTLDLLNILKYNCMSLRHSKTSRGKIQEFTGGKGHTASME